MNRLTEPSSWGGLGVALVGLSTAIPGDFTAFGLGHSEWQVIVVVAGVLCGAAALWLREGKAKE